MEGYPDDDGLREWNKSVIVGTILLHRLFDSYQS